MLISGSLFLGQDATNLASLEAGLTYAKVHSQCLSANRQGVAPQQSIIAGASSQHLPWLTSRATDCELSRATQSATGFPLTQLSSVPGDQRLRRCHLNAEMRDTIPIYNNRRIKSAVSLAEAQRDLAQVTVRDVERGSDLDVTATYTNLVQLDRNIEAAKQSVNDLTGAVVSDESQKKGQSDV